MAYYTAANLQVIWKDKYLTKRNLIDEMACGYGTWNATNHCSENTAPSLRSPAALCRGPKFDYSISQSAEPLDCISTTAGAVRST